MLPGTPREGLAVTTPPTEADFYTQSDVQLFPIGAQLRLNGSLYRYCCAGEAMAAPHFGFLKCSRTICPGATGGGGFEGALYADAAAGATEIQIADTATRAAHYYEDGLLVVMNDTYGYQQYRIVDSDAAAADDDHVHIYIATPGLKRAHTTTGGTLGVYRSPWIDIRSMLNGGNQSWFSAVGMAHLILSSGYFFWLQTAGYASGTGASTWPGQTAYRRTVYANTDGSLISGDATVIYYQPVGYLLSGTASDYGDVFFMMQLDQ